MPISVAINTELTLSPFVSMFEPVIFIHFCALCFSVVFPCMCDCHNITDYLLTSSEIINCLSGIAVLPSTIADKDFCTLQFCGGGIGRSVAVTSRTMCSD